MALNGTTSGLPGSKLERGGISQDKVVNGDTPTNDVFASNDTRMIDVPGGGTLESGGLND